MCSKIKGSEPKSQLEKSKLPVGMRYFTAARSVILRQGVAGGARQLRLLVGARQKSE
jgi:hypothetical protein